LPLSPDGHRTTDEETRAVCTWILSRKRDRKIGGKLGNRKKTHSFVALEQRKLLQTRKRTAGLPWPSKELSPIGLGPGVTQYCIATIHHCELAEFPVYTLAIDFGIQIANNGGFFFFFWFYKTPSERNICPLFRQTSSKVFPLGFQEVIESIPQTGYKSQLHAVGTAQK